MGQHLCHKTNSKRSKIRSHQEQTLSHFYIGCRNGNIQLVEKLLPSMTIEQINRYESNGSTALHAASYYGYKEIVQLLLNAGASRTLRNLQYNLTAYEEARNDDIRHLFIRNNNAALQERFIGLSPKTEWSLDTAYAGEWKTHLANLLEPELSFQEIISFLQDNYLKNYLNLPSRELENVELLFRYAYDNDDVRYLIEAYTSATHFYAIVNNHLAEYILKCFRFDKHLTIIEQCVAHLASIFLHRSELKSLTYRGIVYRGIILHQTDLDSYTVDKCLLNKSFLSTSKDRSIASVFAACENSTNLRITVDKTPLQYTVLCIYIIRNINTAIDISNISEFPTEHEVLIMPLCAFKVKSVQRNENNNDVQIKITLEECNQSIDSRRESFERPRVT